MQLKKVSLFLQIKEKNPRGMWVGKLEFRVGRILARVWLEALLGNSQKYVRIMFTLFQCVNTLGLALRSGLQKHCFGPEDT